MLNQQAIDSLYSATYMEDYLDCMENLPDDIQRNISRMRDLDIQYADYMQELETAMEDLLGEMDAPQSQRRDENQNHYGVKKRRAQEALIRAQDIGDEKLQLAQNVQDNVENKARQLELDKKNLGELTKLRPREYGREMENQEATPKEENHKSSIKRARRARHEVFVPSILGPSTLEVTSYVEATENHPGPSTSRSTHSYHSSALEKPVSSIAISSGSIHFDTSSKSVSYSQPEEPPRPTGRTERSSGKAAERDRAEATEGANHGRGSERGSHSGNTAAPKKATQKEKNADKKVKKRKATTKQTRNQDASPPDPIDPDEPTYCLCDQISYGEMIGCDNDLCPIEWFHFSCVNLTHKPKGKWYCPKCRGDKPNIMKSKALFLKELEKYNREKEEKA